eukprot:scaffold20739_cov105-Isochrysis_galbana.AAC.3
MAFGPRGSSLRLWEGGRGRYSAVSVSTRGMFSGDTKSWATLMHERRLSTCGGWMRSGHGIVGVGCGWQGVLEGGGRGVTCKDGEGASELGQGCRARKGSPWGQRGGPEWTAYGRVTVTGVGTTPRVLGLSSSHRRRRMWGSTPPRPPPPSAAAAAGGSRRSTGRGSGRAGAQARAHRQPGADRGSPPTRDAKRNAGAARPLPSKYATARLLGYRGEGTSHVQICHSAPVGIPRGGNVTCPNMPQRACWDTEGRERHMSKYATARLLGYRGEGTSHVQICHSAPVGIPRGGNVT